jgi:hypothetical protein
MPEKLYVSTPPPGRYSHAVLALGVEPEYITASLI